MSTIRQWLDQNNFDWDSARVVFQPVTDGSYCPGWADEDELLPSQIIPTDHSIFDEEFDSSFGCPNCPRFVAYDRDFVYFPVNYDGSTWVEKISLTPESYVGRTYRTPYPGGG